MKRQKLWKLVAFLSAGLAVLIGGRGFVAAMYARWSYPEEWYSDFIYGFIFACLVMYALIMAKED